MTSVARRLLHRSQQTARTVCTRLGCHGRPDFLILGAQKAGTSALHAYLTSHPMVAAPSAKELYFFSPESFAPWPDFPARHTWRAESEGDPAARRAALRRYHSQFPVPLPSRRRLNHEATTCYLFFPEVARRIHAYRPDMKLIVLLRDPVERAFSAWNMVRGFTFEPWTRMRDTRSFEQAVREEAEGREGDPANPSRAYLARGIYHEQLRRYLDLFPREQLMIIDQGELLTHRLAVVNAACRFLGIEPFRGGQAWPTVNVGTYKGEMSAAARDFLADFFEPHNAALFDLIGREFDWTRPAPPPRLARAGR